MEQAVSLDKFQPICVDNGLWLRPFGKLIYMMPAYTISEEELRSLCRGTCKSIKQYLNGV
jgi:adenosylmethionine-8-amino-7-oxononanoate aminotransferase